MSNNACRGPRIDRRVIADRLQSFANSHARSAPAESHWQELFHQLVIEDGQPAAWIAKLIGDAKRAPSPVKRLADAVQELRMSQNRGRRHIAFQMNSGTADVHAVTLLLQEMHQAAERHDPSARRQYYEELRRSDYHAICQIAERYLASQLPDWVKYVRVVLCFCPNEDDRPEWADGVDYTTGWAVVTISKRWRMRIEALLDPLAEPVGIPQSRRQVQKTRYDAIATVRAAAIRFLHEIEPVPDIILDSDFNSYKEWVQNSTPEFVVLHVAEVVASFSSPARCQESERKKAFTWRYLEQQLPQQAFRDLDVAAGVHGLLTTIGVPSKTLAEKAAAQFASILNEAVDSDSPQFAQQWCERCGTLLPALKLDDMRLWSFLSVGASNSRVPAAWVRIVRLLAGASAAETTSWELKLTRKSIQHVPRAMGVLGTQLETKTKAHLKQFLAGLCRHLAGRHDAVDRFPWLLEETGLPSEVIQFVKCVESLYGGELERGSDASVFQGGIWKSILARNLAPFETAWNELNDRIIDRSAMFAKKFTEAMTRLFSALERHIAVEQ